MSDMLSCQIRVAALHRGATYQGAGRIANDAADPLAAPQNVDSKLHNGSSVTQERQVDMSFQ